VQKSDKESKEGAMTEHIPTPLATRRLVTKHEELRRKREGTWDPTTMVSQTSPEGAALRAHLASPDKVTDAQPIAIELLKNEAPPKFKAACEFTTEKPQGDGEDRTGLVEVPAGDHSPPHEPTSLPTSKAEPLPPGKEATSEAEKPKTETTPLAAIGGKPGRSGGGQPKKEKPPVGIPKSTPKLSPELMRIILNALREYPLLSYAANKAGIHRKTLKYWMDRSAAGDDGYDIKWQGLTRRFHEHCESAIREAHLKLDDEMRQRALFGYDKVLTYRGRVMYQIDQDLVGLGLEGPDAYLKDENGKPVPETVHKVDTKAQLRVLKQHRPNTWGKHPKIDAPREGGVLVVGDVTKKPKYNTARSVRVRKWKADSRMIREEKD
jgi:hypothetical protein